MKRKFQFGLAGFMTFLALIGMLCIFCVTPIRQGRENKKFLEFIKSKNGRVVFWNDINERMDPQFHKVQNNSTWWENLLGLEFDDNVALLEFKGRDFTDADIFALRGLIQASKQQLWSVDVSNTLATTEASEEFWIDGNCVNLVNSDWSCCRNAMNPSRSKVNALLKRKMNRRVPN
jgi:hypothetical protein